MRRPLDGVGSLKLKLGAVIVAAVLVTIAVLELGRLAGWPAPVAAITALLVALALVQVLAHGMTFPLRQMAAAASRLAAGDRHEPVTATSRDEVGDLARAFNQMAEDLAETDRLQRDLIANVSHELRTPITALRAVVENLVDGVEQADPATLAAVLRQIERLQDLVEALLDLSRLEAGVTHLQSAWVSASSVLEESVALVTATPGPDVRLQVEPADLTLFVDEQRLIQVLVNLLSNARRHAPDGTDVALRAIHDTEADLVELSVTDGGEGIATGELERIFERFHRVDQGRESARGGAGLGLAISRWIVDLHGGRLFVDATHRPGCRMVVTLPTDDRRPRD